MGNPVKIQSGKPGNRIWIYEPAVWRGFIRRFSGGEGAGVFRQCSGGFSFGMFGDLCGKQRKTGEVIKSLVRYDNGNAEGIQYIKTKQHRCKTLIEWALQRCCCSA